MLAIDSRQRRSRTFGIPEAEYPLALCVLEQTTGAGVLYDRRSGAGQVADSAVADPAGGEGHIGRPCATELATRPADERAVALRRAGCLEGIREQPAVIAKHGGVVLQIVRVNGELDVHA